MRKTVLSFLTLIIGSGLLWSFAAKDDDPIKTLVLKLEKFRDGYTQEKVYLQFDKPYYSIGDNIWFKAYVVNAETNQLSGLNKILYVDLINEKDSIEKSLRLPLTAGLAWGDFSLLDSLHEGNYRVRAYTNWMRNFGDEYFFDKTIYVGNAFSNEILAGATYSFSKEGIKEKVDADIVYTTLNGQPLDNKEITYTVELNSRSITKGKAKTDANGHALISFVNNQPFVLKSGRIYSTISLDDTRKIPKTLLIKSTSTDTDVQFMPEGGQLVTNIPGRIAFKAVAPEGLGADISGYVIDRNKQRVAEFKSEHAGMGSFMMTPSADNSYTAVVKFRDGSEKNITLPGVQPEGYTLSVNNSNADTLFLRINASAALLQAGEIFVLGQSNSVITYAARNKLQGSALSAKIPKSKFPEGILQLTVFNAAAQPVAERLVFIRHTGSHLNVDIKSAKNSFDKREKTKLDLTITDHDGKPVQGAFSMAVTDEGKVPFDENRETTIFSELLLRSDLKGYVEQPNYYFISLSAEKERQLDNLMLTQGWSRFSWKNLISDSYPPLAYKPEQDITISGKVKTNSGKPVPGGKVTVFATSGQSMILDTITDTEGRFKFDKLVFGDNTRFVVQARDARNKKNVEIEIDQTPKAMVSKNKNSGDAEVNISSDMVTYLKNSQKQFTELRRFGMLDRSIMLNEVKVVEKKPAVKNSSNLNGTAGHADAVITSDQLQTFTDLAQALQGRVAGLILQNGIPYLMRSMNTPMQIVVDGMYFEPEFLSSINVNDVESIEVLKSVGNTAIYGSRGGGGVLVINTKRGEPGLAMNRFVPGIVPYSSQGYSIAREFYSPKYDSAKASDKMPDLRSTIYWNPQIITDKNGKASIEFYNTDDTGTCKVLIEGVDLDGTLAHQIYRYSVK